MPVQEQWRCVAEFLCPHIMENTGAWRLFLTDRFIQAVKRKSVQWIWARCNHSKYFCNVEAAFSTSHKKYDWHTAGLQYPKYSMHRSSDVSSSTAQPDEEQCASLCLSVLCFVHFRLSICPFLASMCVCSYFYWPYSGLHDLFFTIWILKEHFYQAVNISDKLFVSYKLYKSTQCWT